MCFSVLTVHLQLRNWRFVDVERCFTPKLVENGMNSMYRLGSAFLDRGRIMRAAPGQTAHFRGRPSDNQPFTAPRSTTAQFA